MSLDDLKIWFEELKSKYVEIKNDLEKKVVSWYWATYNMNNLEPFHKEINKIAYGKKLKTEPNNKWGSFQIVVNKENKIIIEREYVEFKNQYYETFFIYKKSMVESVGYNY